MRRGHGVGTTLRYSLYSVEHSTAHHPSRGPDPVVAGCGMVPFSFVASLGASFGQRKRHPHSQLASRQSPRQCRRAARLTVSEIRPAGVILSRSPAVIHRTPAATSCWTVVPWQDGPPRPLLHYPNSGIRGKPPPLGLGLPWPARPAPGHDPLPTTL
ncbi:hypothetical protein GQ53DRAFT_749459 [Thozetella sp. PMI_491]|nr:hypothetical protein GQ53DRAFT_749459 [Thozetella sp. PMI_491]